MLSTGVQRLKSRMRFWSWKRGYELSKSEGGIWGNASLFPLITICSRESAEWSLTLSDTTIDACSASNRALTLAGPGLSQSYSWYRILFLILNTIRILVPNPILILSWFWSSFPILVPNPTLILILRHPQRMARSFPVPSWFWSSILS